MVSLATFASTAEAATVNPAEWDFTLLTYGSNAFWTSSPASNVDTSYPQYDYSWEMTQFGLKLDKDGDDWVDILDSIGNKSGSDTAYETPVFDGFDMLDQRYEASEEFGVDIHIYVNADGFGYVEADNIYFGTHDGYSVIGLGFGGPMTVTGIPEPATIALLSFGTLLLLRRRR